MSSRGLEGMVDVALGDGDTTKTEAPSLPLPPPPRAGAPLSVSDDSKEGTMMAVSRASEKVGLASQSSGTAAAAAAAAPESTGGEGLTRIRAKSCHRACLTSSYSLSVSLSLLLCLVVQLQKTIFKKTRGHLFFLLDTPTPRKSFCSALVFFAEQENFPHSSPPIIITLHRCRGRGPQPFRNDGQDERARSCNTQEAP